MCSYEELDKLFLFVSRSSNKYGQLVPPRDKLLELLMVSIISMTSNYHSKKYNMEFIQRILWHNLLKLNLQQGHQTLLAKILAYLQTEI